MPKIAIIDIGSRSVSMEIFSIDGDSFKQIYYNSIATFLGKNISRDGALDSLAIERTQEVLFDYKRIIDSFDEVGRFRDFYTPIEVHAFCTAAVRSATNREEFLQVAQDALGFDANVRVISGDEEAIYEFLGVINSTDMREFVMIDVGGASTELALVKDRKLCRYTSIPLGAVNITEKFFNTVAVQPHRVSEAVHTILPQIEGLDWIEEAKTLPIIACGSCARNLVIAESNKKIATSSSLHGYMINYSNVDFMAKQIAKMSAIEREDKLGIKKENAEIIVGGLVPLLALFKATGSRRMYYSEFSAVYGMFYEQYARINKRASAIEPDVLGASIRRVQSRYNANEQHAKLVEELALSIFRQTFNVHHLGERFRHILSVASLLHDVGEYIQYNNHQEHSFYIIKESDIWALEHQDKFFAALVAGFHRKEKLHFDWLRYFRVINRSTLGTLKDLGEVVQVAEVLAEREPEARGVKVQVEPKAIQLIVEKDGHEQFTLGNSVGRLWGRKAYII